MTPDSQLPPEIQIRLEALARAEAERRRAELRRPETWPVALRPWAEAYFAISDRLGRAAVAVADWVAEHEDGLKRLAEGLANFAAIAPELRRLEAEIDGSGWEHVLEQLDLVNGIVLMVLLDEGGNEAAEELLEEALTTPEFVAALTARIDRTVSEEPHRRQLRAGLDALGRRNYAVAVPLLMNPLEGLIFFAAEDRALVSRVKDKVRIVTPTGVGRPVGGVEDVLGLLGLNEDFHSFLCRQVYGGTGNPFRHGTAQDGFRHRALTLVVALATFVDLVGAERDEGLLVEAFARSDEAFVRAIDKAVAARERQDRRLEAIRTLAQRPRIGQESAGADHSRAA